MKSRTVLLTLCLVSGFGVAQAQKPDRTQKNDAAAKPVGPTIEATQKYIADILADPAKAAAQNVEKKVTSNQFESRAFKGLSLEESCKARYSEKVVGKLLYSNDKGMRETTRLIVHELDFSKLRMVELRTDKAGYESSLFNFYRFWSSKDIADIPYQFILSVEGWRSRPNGDTVDLSEPDKTGTDKESSVDLLVEFKGIYAEKSKKAFEHLLNECAKRSGEPKELF